MSKKILTAIGCVLCVVLIVMFVFVKFNVIFASDLPVWLKWIFFLGKN